MAYTCREFNRLDLVLAVSATSSVAAWAAPAITTPLSIVVGYATGSSTDRVGR